MDLGGGRWRLRRDVLLLTVAIWLFFSIWLMFGQIAFGDESLLSRGLGKVLARRFGASVAGMALCMLVYLALERALNRPFWQLIAVALALGVPGGLLVLTLERWTAAAIETGSFFTLAPAIPREMVFQRVHLWTFFFLSWVIGVLALVYGKRVIAEQRLRAEAQALAHHAMLKSLRYQLNPHFLFNALNSIGALVVDQRSDEAERMIGRLSDFLRAGLDTDPLEEVRLATEIAQQRRYLEIERIRFPNRLAFRFEIASEAEGALVPSLILQPLVENAIKYAVTPSPRLVTIIIEAVTDGGLLKIRVADDGPTGLADGAGAGIGLANVRQRLASSFGESATLNAGPVEGGGFVAELRMPLGRDG